MSNFIDCEPGVLIPLGSSIADMVSAFKTAFTSRGWQVIRESVAASSYFGSIANYASAFDESTQTAAGSSGTTIPCTVGFQAPSAFTPSEMWIQSGFTSLTLTANPKDFELQYSDNGTDWTTHQSWTNESNFGQFEARKYAIAGASSHTYWQLKVTAKGSTGTYLGIIKLFLADSSGLGYGSEPFLDVIPPSSETIGNSTAHDFCRIFFTGTLIRFSPRMKLKTDLPAIASFSAPTGGAVTLSVTINGATVSYTGADGDSGLKNLIGLYDAIRASANANFTGLTWIHLGGSVFYAKQNTPAPGFAPAASNLTANVDNRMAYAGPQSVAYGGTTDLPCDLVSGFIYYLQVNARGFAIATKLNSGFYGPIHVCWEDNANALDAIPSATHPFLPPMTPVELAIGTDDATASDASGVAKLSHCWGVVASGNATPNNPENGQYGTAVHPFTCHHPAGEMLDINGSVYASQPWDRFPEAFGSGMFDSEAYGPSPWNVQRLVVPPQWTSESVYNALGGVECFSPGLSTLDWYRYVGTLTNEQVVLCPMPDFTATVSVDCLALDNTIQVGSTAGWPAQGWLVINGEVISYSGKTSGAFTGCVRAQKGTLAAKHYIGDTVAVGGFHIKINTGLIFCGYEEPI